MGITMTRSEIAAMNLTVEERREMDEYGEQAWCSVCMRPMKACLGHRKLRLGDRDLHVPTIGQKVKAVREDRSLEPFVGRLVNRLAKES